LAEKQIYKTEKPLSRFSGIFQVKLIPCSFLNYTMVNVRDVVFGVKEEWGQSYTDID
jgi:hypothetical protein